MEKSTVDKLLYDFLETAYLFEKFEEHRFVLNWQEIYALQLLIKKGEMTLNSLGSLLRLEKYQATRLISRLESGGYISKLQSIGDRRVFLVSVSDKGEEAIEEIEKFHYELFQNELKELEADDLEKMGRVVSLFAKCVNILK